MTYTKKDAQMTRGLAILCMVVLHLFCRQGADVFGSPLLWLNEETPVVFLFGFFAEICVPLYSLCVGYGQQLLWETGKTDLRSRGRRILRLLTNYWIVLVLFSCLGLLFDSGKGMPGDWIRFLKSTVLLHSYNGAWWYINTYILVLLLPPALLLAPVQKMSLISGLLFSGTVHVLWYLIGKFDLIPAATGAVPAMAFLRKEAENLIGILAYVWTGGLLCKYRLVDKAAAWYGQHVCVKWQKLLLAILAVLLFVATNIVHKWVVMGGVAVCVFLMFNIWEKGPVTEKVMLFLGKHSTNIWLVHMFFYAYFLKGLVFWAKNPAVMFAALMAWCIASSCVIMKIDEGIQKVVKRLTAR